MNVDRQDWKKNPEIKGLINEKRFMVFCLLSFVFVNALFRFNVYSDPFIIEHAYYRKLHPVYDNGTVHLFLLNRSDENHVIQKVWINDEEITDKISEISIWKHILPNPVLPGMVTDVMVKMAHPLNRLTKIEVMDESGNLYSRVIQPLPLPLRIVYVGFANNYKKICVWITNTGDEDFKTVGIYLNGMLISQYTKLPFIAKGETKSFIKTLDTPLKQGTYIAIKIQGEDDVLCESLTRVFSYFPISSWDGDNRKNLGFDSKPFLMSFPKNKKEFEDSRNSPWFQVYHLFNDPACEDRRKNEPLGFHAQTIIERHKTCYSNDPFHPTSIYVCEHRKPFNYFVYGELADIIMANPFEIAFYGNSPEKNGEFFRLAKLASEPRLTYAIVDAFKDTCPQRNYHRFPTYDEEIKNVLCFLKAGTKGLIYFMGNFEGNGYNDDEALLKALALINPKVRSRRHRFLLKYP